MAVIVLLVSGMQAGGTDQHLSSQYLSNHSVVGPCPGDDKTNRAIMKEYLTIPEWESARRETNTDHLTPSEIRLVKAPEFSSVCEKFNTQYLEAFSETWSSGGKTYNVTYYKVGDYFFVIISLRQPESANYAATEVAYLGLTQYYVKVK